jgi:hypothetical protein
MRKFTRVRRAVVASALGAFVLATGAGAAVVANGNFETGDFTGWTKANTGSGDWFVYTGTSSPLVGLPIAPPPEGTYAAVTDMPGPGSHILYQDVALEPGHSHMLSFILYYENRAGVFFSPDTLSTSAGPNQQYRVDIMDPAAPVDSVSTGVLATVFRTMPGDPPSKPYTPMAFDLSPYAGQTVRLRFAEVDNQFFFNASADNVRVDSVRLVPNHFLRYQLDQPEATGETVTLVDQFGERRVRLEEAEWLLNPTDKRRAGRPVEPIQRANEHLVCYGLPYIPTPDRSVMVRNQFGTSTLRVGRPLTLCTPASKTVTGDPGPPPTDMDHYLCYDVRGESPLFPSETLVVKDQFGERTIRIDRTRELCNPVEKRRDGRPPEPIKRPDEHYVCYRMTTQTPPFTGLGVITRDQFALQTLRVPTLERLCVPSSKDEGGGAA